MILGIDEAGRGCVIGPLVITGYLIFDSHSLKLKDLGVKDSKQLTYDERKDLFSHIKRISFAVKTIKIPPEEIDLKLRVMSLNDLETMKMAEIINEFPEAKSIIIDCPDVNINKFKGFLYRYLKDKNKINNVVAEHKADVNYPVVSAASIIAKVLRDEEIEKIKYEIKHNIGSGYPSDPLTQKFLDENWNKYDSIFRHCWQTWIDVKNKKMQKNLFDFSK